MKTDCVFCKIASGALPAHKIYEDADTLAFLDIGPIVKGHTLVIPKAHHDPLAQTPLETLRKLIAVVQKVAVAQTKALKADGVNIVQSNGRAAGQVVFHIHFHVIPRFANDGHSWQWRPRSYADSGEMSRMAAEIKTAIVGPESGI